MLWYVMVCYGMLTVMATHDTACSGYDESCNDAVWHDKA